MTAITCPAAADIHPRWCDCSACEPYLHAQADRATAADHWGMLTVAGLGAGLVVCWIVDLVVGGPGISVMFGA